METNIEVYEMLILAFGEPTRKSTNNYESDYGNGSGDAYYWEPTNSSIRLKYFLGSGVYCSLTYTHEILNKRAILQKEKDKQIKAEKGF